MNVWCYRCEKFTEHKTTAFLDNGHRDLGSGERSDRRVVKCTVCGAEHEADFAPDRR